MLGDGYTVEPDQERGSLFLQIDGDSPNIEFRSFAEFELFLSDVIQTAYFVFEEANDSDKLEALQELLNSWEQR